MLSPNQIHPRPIHQRQCRGSASQRISLSVAPVPWKLRLLLFAVLAGYFARARIDKVRPLAHKAFDRLESVIVRHLLGDKALDEVAGRRAAVEEGRHAGITPQQAGSAVNYGCFRNV